MAYDGKIVLGTEIDTSGIKNGTNNIKSALEKLKEKFKSLGESQAKAFDINDSEAIKKIENIKRKIAELEKERDAIVEEIESINSEYMPEFNDPTKLEDLKMEDFLPESVLKKVDELIKKYDKLSAAIESAKEALGMLGDEGEAKLNKLGKAFSNIGKRIKNMTARLLVFSAIYKAIRACVDYFKKLLNADEQFRNDWNELKAAFKTAAQPLINIIIPAVRTIVSIVRDWAVAIGKIAAALSGMTYKQFVEQAKAAEQAADSYDNIEKSAKETEKALAGFDDIQILSSGNSGETSSNDYSGFDSLSEGEDATSGVVDTLGAVLTAAGGLIAAIGLILLTKGQIPWGLAFIIAGAAFWAISEIAQGTFSTDSVTNMLIKIMAIAGTALLAIGLILLVFGQIAWGIAALAVGAVAIVTAVALTSDTIISMIQGPLGIIMGIVGAALLVLGIILICTGVGIPLGLALIAAGAASLATAIVVNKDALLNMIKSVWSGIVNFWNKYIYPGIKQPIEIVKNLFSDIISTIRKNTSNIKKVFQAIISFIKNVFKGDWKAAWQSIGDIFTAVWTTIKDVFKGVINIIIDCLNLLWSGLYKAIAGVVNGVGSIVSKFGDLIGQDWGFSIPKDPPLIPRLAQGAVIPANSEFLAVLGDQKHGTNIEAPASLIKQMVIEALNERGGESGNTTVILELDGRELGRAVVSEGARESRRIGTKLVVI